MLKPLRLRVRVMPRDHFRDMFGEGSINPRFNIWRDLRWLAGSPGVIEDNDRRYHPAHMMRDAKWRVSCRVRSFLPARPLDVQ